MSITKTGNGKYFDMEYMPFLFSALNFTTSDLDPGITKKQQHTSDLTPRKEVYLNIDLFQRGLGGDNSWGALPLSKYRYEVKPYSYSFNIQVK